MSSGNFICDEGADVIAELIEKTSTLKELNLSGKLVVVAIYFTFTLSFLRKLHWSKRCKQNRGSTEEEQDTREALSWWYMCPFVLFCICVHFNLDNKIKDDYGLSIFGSLGSNTTLTELDLSGNSSISWL